MRMTFRMPERYSVASGTALVHEHVVDDTRIMGWISDDLVRFMSFSFGRFEVTVLNEDGLPPISSTLARTMSASPQGTARTPSRT